MYTTGTLLRTAEITPRMLRLTFRVPGCRATERPDDWLMLFFGEPGDHSMRRNYTVRAVRPEAEELDIDFALHDGGLAATWAKTAQPGDRARLERGRWRLRAACRCASGS